MLTQLQTLAPPTTNVTDGTYPVALGGKSGEAIVSELHGIYYTSSLRKQIFMASTLAAGAVIPFNAATMTSKFTLHNPAGSGKIIELIDLTVLQVPGSALITGLGMGFQGPLASTGGVPGTLTTGAIGTTYIGSGTSSVAVYYTSAVLTNVAIANLSPILWMFNNVATTVITQGPANYNFQGKVILPPDTLCALCNSITGTQSAAPITLTWAEYPL